MGLGGGVLLAASAWLAGALLQPVPTQLTWRFVLGLAAWVAGAVVVSVAWRRGGGTPLMFLPLIFSPPLGSRDVYAYTCQGWLWLHDMDPYRVGAATGGCPWTASVPQIWQDTPAPYGPLAIALSGLAAATGSQIGALIVLRGLALAGVAILAWQLPKLGGRGALLLGVFTPLVAVHGISGAHNDMLMAGCIVAALASAKTPIRAGLWIAAAMAIKITAIVALPFVLILIGRRWWTALGTAVVAFATVSFATGLDLGWIAALRNTGELVQWSSLPTAVGMAFGYIVGPQAVTVARVIGLIVLAALAVYAVHKARQGHAIVACGGLLAATALLGPVFYPWYAIAALAILAASTAVPPKWIVIPTLVCAFLTLPNGHGIPAMTKAPGAYAVTILLAIWVFRTLRPARGA